MSKKPAHFFCDHPATKAARAKCRRQNTAPNLVTFAYNQLGWDINALRLSDDNAAELREALAQATGLDYATRVRLEGEIEQYVAPKISMSNADVQEYDRFQQRLARELDEADKNPGQMPAPAEREITRENWRDYRDQDVEMEITIYGPQASSKRVGRITAWGEKFMSYTGPNGGKSTRVATERVIRATLKK